jgi:FAD/FMN-containing dehydrogenase
MSHTPCFPAFAGELRLDEPGRRASASNFGRHVERLPLAVLAPASLADVQAMVRFARAEGLPLAARGQSHSTFAQGLVEGGVVLDMRSLAGVRELGRESVLVDAGARWSTVLAHTLPEGLGPPTLTDYQELSVGGTLSVGGVGGEAHHHGAQVDNVLELSVITGAGDHVICSATQEPELFHACLGGLGQAAILCAARLRLVAAPERVRSFVVKYATLGAFLGDLRILAGEGRFQHLYGNITLLDGGRWDFELVATEHVGDGNVNGGKRLLEGLSFIAGSQVESVSRYVDFVHRVDAAAVAMKQAGLWDLPHPWLDLFVPASTAGAFIGAELGRLSHETLGQGGILIYPLQRSRRRAEHFALPDEEQIFLFDVFRNASPSTPAQVEALLEENRRAYLACVAQGGTLYPIGSTPMTPADWQRHFHPHWERFLAAKRRFDPAAILTPGPGIFA